MGEEFIQLGKNKLLLNTYSTTDNSPLTETSVRGAGRGRIFMLLSMNDFLPGCLYAVVVIKCFMIGVNV